MTHRRVVVSASRAELTESVAKRLLKTLRTTLEREPAVHVVLTGGSVGIEILEAVAASKRGARVDWARVHVWWGDERWLPAGDAERNDHQADVALLDHVGIPAEHVHRFAASDAGLTLDEAADAYAAELHSHAPDGESTPQFDILLLGVGPDAHIASLFPESDGVRVTDRTVIAVRNSPKPPPERLSLTMPAIRRAERVWLCLAGADKSSALSLALAGASPVEVPAAGVMGIRRTVFFADPDAAQGIPAEIISDYH